MNAIFPRTLLALLAAGAIPIALMLVVVMWWAGRAMDESKQQSTLRVAREVATQIEIVLSRAAEELGALAQDEQLLDPTMADDARLAEMKRLGKMHGAFTEIAIYDNDGYIIESTSALSATQETTSWFRAALKSGEPTRSRPFLDSTGKCLVYSVYAPAAPVTPTDVAMVKATLPFDRVNELVRSMTLRGGEKLVVLDQFGNCVGRSWGECLFERFDPGIRSDNWPPSGRYQTPDGARYRFVSAKASPANALPDEHLRLVWLTPEGYFTSARREVICWIAGIGFLTIVPLCGLGYLLARSLSLPVIRAATGARKVADGDFNARLETGGICEMHDLGSAFNAMVDTVRERTLELEEANKILAHSGRMKDRFLATMSHELRTPLNAIIGFSEALQANVYGELAATQQGSVQAIKDGGERLLALIDDILDVAKLTAGELELHPGDVRLKAICDASLGKARNGARAKSFKLTSSIDQSAIIRCDSRRAQQMLDNLIDNAIKFTPQGGLIHIEARQDAAAGEAVIRVIDTGIGIAEFNLARLFHPFIQLDASGDREHGGAGLGLTIVRELAELHGGSIAVESKPGVGSEFILRLPLAADCAETAGEPAPDAPGSLSPPRPRDASTRIVLIEDNDLITIPVRNLLQSMDHHVRVARNGAEAIDFARANPPELIVLDAQTIGDDPAGVLGDLSHAAGRERIPSIALTTRDDPRLLQTRTRGGPDRYLAKPVQLAKLEDAIHDLLSA